MKPTPFKIFLIIAGVATTSLRAEVNPSGFLGDAPTAPKDVSGLPGAGPRPLIVTGGFSVNTSSRQQVREFYNSVYTSSAGVPMNSSAVTASCIPGTNSTTFVDVTLRRINWFRALAGLPAVITFNAAESTKNQAAALMMSSKNGLQHSGSWVGWNCFSSDGTNASANSNLALGNAGPDAITAYIWDFGGNNSVVGHRRWILYPQTQVMGTGDIPAQGTNLSANATWIFDANYGGPRPVTRTPYVTWPPAGYVPYQVVYPQWSFALSNSDFSTATVTMASNGVPVTITKQSYATGAGENTLVWYPSTLNFSNSTAFPFNGTDTVYTINVNSVITPVGTKNYAYTVTLFDPAIAGPDYSPLVISGPSQPSVGGSNPYTCTASTNPAITGYQWLVSQTTNGYLVDNALNGMTNFTISPAINYPPITNAPNGSGNCFHLTHNGTVPLQFQLKEVLFPTNNTTINFKSLLGYATTVEVACLQVSIDGGSTWQDVYTQLGTSSSGESAFTQRIISLASFAGKSTLVRFSYDYVPGSNNHYIGPDPYIGWCLQNIVVTNSLQLLNQVTSSTASTNFVFTPTQISSYLLQARGVIFTEFPTDIGTAKQVTAIAGAPQITLNSLSITGSQVKIKFTLSSGTASSFHLLQQNQLGTAWATNGTALLTTNVPGSQFQFTTTNGPAMRFYRVQTP